MTQRITLIIFLALTAWAVFGQSPVPPSFEVASVKPVDPMSRSPRDFRILPGGALRVTNLPLNVIIREAFGVKSYQISGGPGWMNTDRFDISAKAAGDPGKEQMMAMLQTLLADRFQLKTRRETKEGNVYALLVAKNGARLKESTATDFYIRLYRNNPPDQPGVNYTIAGQKASLALIADRLSEMELHRPVLDRTGIKGEFDFKLNFTIDDEHETGPSIFSAIQEQLGLRLEATKGPVETLVIEHAEKPSAN